MNNDTSTGGGFNVSSMMSLFMLIIAVLLFYCAITGKGPAYDSQNVRKDKKEEYHQFMRKICWILGPIMLASAACDYFREQLGALGDWGVWITLGVGFVIIVYAAVYTVRNFNIKVEKSPKKKK